MNDIKIIAVDDEPTILQFIDSLASLMELKIELFATPTEALYHAINNPVDIVLTDYMMPDMDGIELIKSLRVIHSEILSIMITAVGQNEDVKINALEAGANDFLSKPLNVVEFQLRIKNLIAIKKSQLLQKNFNNKLEEEVKKATENLRQQEFDALQVLSNTAEYKDPETASHVARVAHYSKLLAKLYGLGEEEQERIFYASPLHDIGKVGIRDDILLKPGKLDPDEFEYMKTHAMIGYEILKDSKNPFLQAGAVIAKEHHEKFDGSGYPNALNQEQIHIYARITAIADVFDALTSKRPYKKAWSFEEALLFLNEQKGKHFDPALIELFSGAIEDVKEIYTKYEE
ncbi:MAG: response regulator [Campylobacterales bacterium]|nr:response regulator [Campylobacterales bacterium]